LAGCLGGVGGVVGCVLMYRGLGVRAGAGDRDHRDRGECL
jgi:hypothetical protein